MHPSNTPPGLLRLLSHDAAVTVDAGVVGIDGGEDRELAPGHRLALAIVYLAAGDYDCFYSPANWVVEKRSHVSFAGELFLVSPRG